MLNTILLLASASVVVHGQGYATFGYTSIAGIQGSVKVCASRAEAVTESLREEIAIDDVTFHIQWTGGEVGQKCIGVEPQVPIDEEIHVYSLAMSSEYATLTIISADLGGYEQLSTFLCNMDFLFGTYEVTELIAAISTSTGFGVEWFKVVNTNTDSTHTRVSLRISEPSNNDSGFTAADVFRQVALQYEGSQSDFRATTIGSHVDPYSHISLAKKETFFGIGPSVEWTNTTRLWVFITTMLCFALLMLCSVNAIFAYRSKKSFGEFMLDFGESDSSSVDSSVPDNFPLPSDLPMSPGAGRSLPPSICVKLGDTDHRSVSLSSDSEGDDDLDFSGVASFAQRRDV